MNKAVVDLVNSGVVNNSLKVGEKVPDFSLPNATGKTVKLNSLLTETPVIISFYRGGWCPYCNMELRGLQKYLPQITELGAKLIAISPETPDNSLSTTVNPHKLFKLIVITIITILVNPSFVYTFTFILRVKQKVNIFNCFLLKKDFKCVDYN